MILEWVFSSTQLHEHRFGVAYLVGGEGLGGIPNPNLRTRPRRLRGL